VAAAIARYSFHGKQWLLRFFCPPLLPLQVFELLPGADLQAVWDEAALLRQCTHERIVSLFGVAVQVGGPLLPNAAHCFPLLPT
jgi:hypothetical protein